MSEVFVRRSRWITIQPNHLWRLMHTAFKANLTVSTGSRPPGPIIVELHGDEAVIAEFITTRPDLQPWP